jgi:hypothetical protein
MCGGYYGYTQHKVLEFADTMDYDLAHDIKSMCSHNVNTDLRKAFVAHLRLVCAAMHAIDWNDAGDGDATEIESIKRCLSTESAKDALIAKLHGVLNDVASAMDANWWEDAQQLVGETLQNWEKL